MSRVLKIAATAMVMLYFGWARASTNSSDITDIWWNTESSWGTNIVVQDDAAFMTFFVYDTAKTAVWYTSDMQFQGKNASGASIWTGNLYPTKGPWFSSSSSASSIRQAGTVSFVLSSLNQAALTYSIDGVSVTKSMKRQTWTVSVRSTHLSRRGPTVNVPLKQRLWAAAERAEH